LTLAAAVGKYLRVDNLKTFLDAMCNYSTYAMAYSF